MVYIFQAKRADRIKLLYWYRTGVVLTAKALEHAVFRWPTSRPPDRKAKRPTAYLSNFKGVLQVDGYAGYRTLT